jgi:hypothetical protein
MKTRLMIFGLAVLLLLGLCLTPAPAAAQEGDPPQETAMPEQVPPPTPPDTPKKDPSDPIDLDSERKPDDDIRTAWPKTEVLPIAAESGVNEDYSDVAYGYSEYGIAYIKDGETYIAFFNSDGTFIQRYMLSDGHQKASHLAVAFDGYYGYFVVAWQHDFMGQGDDQDIKIRAATSSTGPVGDIKMVANSGYDETNPDLDCNHNDASCLVVFNFEGLDDYFRGRFMPVEIDGMDVPVHDLFRVSSGNEAYDPHVAWGDSAGTYMVVYRWPGNTEYASSGIFTHLLDTYQESSVNQYLYNGTWLVTPTDLPYDKWPSDVAFDPVTEKYLVLFSYDCLDTGSDFDIRMTIKHESDWFGYGPGSGIEVAFLGSGIDETGGRISFLTSPWWAANFDIGPDKLAVAYIRSDSETSGIENGIVTVVITGNGSTSAPEYTVPAETEHTLVKAPFPSLNSFVTRPAVVGRDGLGDYMVTWTDYLSGFVSPYDVNGMILMDNAAPYFISTEVTSAEVDEVYTYDVTTTDLNMPGGDELTITADTKPGWLMLSDNGDGTAILSGTPALGDVGDHSVTLRVTDLDGAFDTQSFTVTVVKEPDFSVYLPLVIR